MESPVVVDKPPEYHGNATRNSGERGFPFDEEEGSGAWSELAARHPDIAARLRQRPATATWARKRRPSSQDATDDFGDGFGGFDRFPFDDIPPEFREHFPSHWNRRFGSRDESEPQAPPPPPPQPQSPNQQTTATQTEQHPGPSQQEQQSHLPQYGLRNTVDLGQKSPADPSVVDAEERAQRSMSAPPDNRTNSQNTTHKMSDQNHQEPPQSHHNESSNVRHIPIFVEGRDEPVINKSVDHGEAKQPYVPPQHHAPPQPHVDREQYFGDDGPVGFHAPPNFSRAFGTPFNTYRQGPQPFAQQKVYPQTAFARGASPQRSQSPKPQMFPEEHFVSVPVRHEYSKNAPPSKPRPAQQSQPPPQQRPPQQQQAPPQQPQQHSPKQPTPPRQEPAQPQAPQQPKPQPPSANDPISIILSIQTDVLNLMTDVENFTGTKKDKKYVFLDEMLTRNLIKLDNIETDGKENIRQARKEAIKCIQKCIAVLEAKADNKNISTPQPQEQAQDVEMKENPETAQETAQPVTENGEIEMKEDATTKEEANKQPPAEQQPAKPVEEKPEMTPQVHPNSEVAPENKEENTPQVVDTRPEQDNVPEQNVEAKQEENKKEEEKKKTKGSKNLKKRDKSKDNKEVDSNKDQVENNKAENVEVMQVDAKGDKPASQTMEVDGAASQ